MKRTKSFGFILAILGLAIVPLCFAAPVAPRNTPPPLSFSDWKMNSVKWIAESQKRPWLNPARLAVRPR